MPNHHGEMEQRGMNEAATTPSGRVRSYRFANRFAHLRPYDRADEFLDALGAASVENGEAVGPMVGATDSDREADVPAGMPFFGQFIDHEITFDPTSSLERRNDPQALRNFRTPALDLDSLYGSGPEVSPYLYDGRDADRAKLLTGPVESVDPADEDQPRSARFGATDLQRNDQGAALITDPRNDENAVLSQLMLAFIRYHNQVVDYLRSGDGHHLLDEDDHLLETAERVVRWHYQWLVRNEFLPQTCDHSVLDDLRRNGRRYFLRSDDPVAIPVEFGGAAYRYGHSQIRDRYDVNDEAQDVPFFPGPDAETMMQVMENGGAEMEPPAGVEEMESETALTGFAPVADELVVDWSYFFDHHPEAAMNATNLQPARPIDAALPPALFVLPFVGEGPESLAARNLRRGKALGLPSGQAVAAEMGIDPLANDDLPLGESGTFGDHLRSVHRGADTEAPLWLYVLAEADAQQDGNRLGAVGSRIVAEVITGMVDADPAAYPNEEPDWRPTMPRPVSAPDDRTDPSEPYRLADLLRVATGPSLDGLEIASLDADGTGDAPDTPADDPTGGEAVELQHTGSGPLPLSGYTVDFGDGQTATFTTGQATQADDVTVPVEHLDPGESLVVYTGDGPDGEVTPHTAALGRDAAAINDAGETVVVQTPTGTVSAYATHSP